MSRRGLALGCHDLPRSLDGSGQVVGVAVLQEPVVQTVRGIPLEVLPVLVLRIEWSTRSMATSRLTHAGSALCSMIGPSPPSESSTATMMALAPPPSPAVLPPVGC